MRMDPNLGVYHNRLNCVHRLKSYETPPTQRWRRGALRWARRRKRGEQLHSGGACDVARARGRACQCGVALGAAALGPTHHRLFRAPKVRRAVEGEITTKRSHEARSFFFPRQMLSEHARGLEPNIRYRACLAAESRVAVEGGNTEPALLSNLEWSFFSPRRMLNTHG